MGSAHQTPENLPGGLCPSDPSLGARVDRTRVNHYPPRQIIITSPDGSFFENGGDDGFWLGIIVYIYIYIYIYLDSIYL